MKTTWSKDNDAFLLSLKYQVQARIISKENVTKTFEVGWRSAHEIESRLLHFIWVDERIKFWYSRAYTHEYNHRGNIQGV
jgi:hypothetical protein